jgi:hypothetical protein
MKKINYLRLFYLTSIITILFPSLTYADFPIGPFHWKQGEAMQQMPSVQDHVCVLTKVSGKFRDASEIVRVWHTDYFWFLTGQSSTQDVSASAYCFAHAAFSGDGPDYWNSEPFSVAFTGRGRCTSQRTETWWGDAATFISAVSGELIGGGEGVEITQSSEGYKASILSAHTCRKKSIGGMAYAFFVGKAHAGHSGRFWGPNGVGSASFAGEYEVTPYVKSVEMAPVEQAMCYFTRVAGGFNGGGEFAKIEPFRNNKNQMVWQLSAQTKSGGGVYAKARCFRRDQTCGAAGCTNQRFERNETNGDGVPASEPKNYKFCVIGPGSGAQQKEYDIVAKSYSDAEIQLKKQLPVDMTGWTYTLGECLREHPPT